MLSRAENRLCMQALLTRGRGGEDEAIVTRLAALHKSCCSSGAGRCPYRRRRRLVEQTPALVKGDGHALANRSEDFGAGWHWDPHAQVQLGQPYSKPSARAGCHQTCRRRCQGVREIKDQPLPSFSHPTAGSQERPQLPVSDEESGLALFVRNWAWDQLSSGIRCV